jgi:hypothetical protein
MPTLRIVRNTQNVFCFRGSGKQDGPNDMHIGDLSLTDVQFQVLKIPANGQLALGLYKAAFEGKGDAHETIEQAEDEVLRGLLMTIMAAGEAARVAHGSTEFVLATEGVK